MELVPLVVLGAYVSLIVELVFFPIPSEASTFQIFFKGGAGSAEHDVSLDRARRRALGGKLLFYLLPTGLCVLLFLLPLALLAHPPLRDRLGPVPALETSGWVAAGIALVLAGRALTFTSVLQLRRHKRDGTLGAAGLFERSRNPGLVGMYLCYMGNALLFPCVVLLAGILPYVWNMHQRVLMEEEHLARSLGSEYKSYLDRVPRYLPLRNRR